MSEKKPKLKHYIATHTFHSAKVRKEFREVNSHRKKNSDWFGNESIELKQSFFKLLKDRAQSREILMTTLRYQIMHCFTKCFMDVEISFSAIGLR